jgi:hypothetical protein
VPVPAGSYSLSTVFKALGLRDPRVIPALSPGQIQGTINFGNLDALVSEVVEAREIVVSGRETAIPDNQWEAVNMLSVAPGGTIIEFLAVQTVGPPPDTVRWTVNMAPVTQPFVPAGSVVPFPIGGQAVQNVWFDSGLQANPRVEGDDFPGGSRAEAYIWPTTAAEQGLLFSRVWVPPSWSFWVLFGTQIGGLLPIGQTDSWELVIRAREIPQALGAV